MKNKILYINIFSTIALIIIFSHQNCIASYNFQQALSQIHLLANALDVFQLDVGRYPSNEEGLVVLLENNNELVGWNGPYIEKKKIPLDPWNKDYQYIYPAKYGSQKFDLYSFGRNGLDEFGKGDDISQWKGYNHKYYKTKESYFFHYIIFIFISGLLITIIIALILKNRRLREKKKKII